MTHEEALKFLDGCTRTLTSRALRDGCRAAANALAEIDGLREKNARQATSIDELLRDVAERDKQIDGLRAKNASQAAHVSEILDELAAKNNLVDGLRNIVSRDGKRIVELVSRVHDLKDLHSQAEKAREQAALERDGMRQTLSDKTEEAEAYKKAHTALYKKAHTALCEDLRRALGSRHEQYFDVVDGVRDLVREAEQAKAQIDAMRPAHDANERAFQALGGAGFQGTLVERAEEAARFKHAADFHAAEDDREIQIQRESVKFWRTTYDIYFKHVRGAFGGEITKNEDEGRAIKRLVAEVRDLRCANTLLGDKVVERDREAIARKSALLARLRRAEPLAVSWEHAAAAGFDDAVARVDALVDEVRDLRAKAASPAYDYQWAAAEVFGCTVIRLVRLCDAKVMISCQDPGSSAASMRAVSIVVADGLGLDVSRIDTRHPSTRT